MQLARVSGTQPVTGQYLVGPDGTINLRQYGVVHVAGKTVTEARLAIQKHLKQFLDSPELSVDVMALQQQGVLRDHAGGRAGRQRAAAADHRQRDGAGRDCAGERAVAVFEQEDLDCPAGAGQFRLPADPAGRLGRRSRRAAETGTNYQICRATGCSSPRTSWSAINNVMGKVTAPFERLWRHRRPEHLDHPRLPDDGPQLQQTTRGILIG